jgi:hypothetical protein
MRAWLILPPLLAACAAQPAAAPAAPAAPAVSVAKSFGGKQCEAGGAGLAALAAQLAQAGVTVQRQACGDDGRLRAAMCGAPDGRIAIFTIPAAQQVLATQAQFVPLAALPDAREQPCR